MSLREEIRQGRPFDGPEEEAILNIHRTAAVLGQEGTAFFRRWDLTPAQYNTLRILRGSQPESLPCGEIRARMVTTVPDVTRLLDRMEKKGLVRRERCEGDRRVVRVAITDAGVELLADIAPHLSTWNQSRLDHLGPEDLRLLSRLLERVRERVVTESHA